MPTYDHIEHPAPADGDVIYTRGPWRVTYWDFGPWLAGDGFGEPGYRIDVTYSDGHVMEGMIWQRSESDARALVDHMMGE